VWKVRVNDTTSELNGKKFEVASTHEALNYETPNYSISKTNQKQLIDVSFFV